MLMKSNFQVRDDRIQVSRRRYDGFRTQPADTIL